MFTIVLLHLNYTHKARYTSIEEARAKFTAAFPAWRTLSTIRKHPNSVAVTIPARQTFDAVRAALN